MNRKRELQVFLSAVAGKIYGLIFRFKNHVLQIRSLIILLLIIVSLLPFYIGGKWLEKKLQPRSSFRRFFTWMILVLLIVFVYTFLLVLAIRLLFPPS